MQPLFLITRFNYTVLKNRTSKKRDIQTGENATILGIDSN
ncbi:hypothetical protein BOVAB4_1207 [Bacteroides ovatus]|nr:hypothetical protein BOVA115_1456 [Bacteroides ovatus]CAG9908238.1 hypothetical protein BOVAB4_1207 [Bacteroides ovatus]